MPSEQVWETFKGLRSCFGAPQVRQTYWQPRPEEASYARLNALADTVQRVLLRCLERLCETLKTS